MRPQRSVLLREWEVLAYLSGRKRMIARPIADTEDALTVMHTSSWTCPLAWYAVVDDGDEWRTLRCPFGSPGDVLAGKEAFAPLRQGAYVPPSDATYALFKDGAQQWKTGEYYEGRKEYATGAFDHIVWRPSQHMPAWAVRIHLRTEAVTAKRVSQITEEEALALGVGRYDNGTFGLDSPACCMGSTTAIAFRRLWDSDWPRTPLASDPWIWLATAPRVEGRSQ